MKRDEYFSFLKETSALVSPIFLKYMDPFLNIDKELYETLMFFVRRRINKPLMKLSLLRLSYEICGGKDWSKIIPAAAAFEFINISSYQANCAFDNKLGVITRSQKDSQFIASIITRELTSQIITELRKDFNESLLNAIYASLSKSNYYINLAQHYDLNILNIKNYENYQDENLFLKDYINRCYYGSGIFNGQCAYIGGLLAHAQQEQSEALREFGENFGTALQIVNDIGDFVPTDVDSIINRDYQDQYSDFKNGRLTLPLYHLLRFGSFETLEIVNEIIKKKDFTKESLLKITHLLLKEGSVSYAKEIAREFIRKAEKQLCIFNESESKKLLLIMSTIIITNKYFVALRKFTKENLKSKRVFS